MEKKCYEIRLVDCPGPLAAGQKLWERVATINRKTDRWQDVARRLLAAGKNVACRSCGCKPGTTWIEGKEQNSLQDKLTTQDYVCDEHATRVALEK